MTRNLLDQEKTRDWRFLVNLGGIAALLANFVFRSTYLSSGIAAVGVSLALILWTISFIYRKQGPTIFLFLFILLFLVGGGIAQVGFFPDRLGGIHAYQPPAELVE